MLQNEKKEAARRSMPPWPAPRLKRFKVDELYKYAPTARVSPISARS